MRILVAGVIALNRESGKSKCPKCGSKKVTFVPGRVNVVTSKKS